MTADAWTSGDAQRDQSIAFGQLLAGSMGYVATATGSLSPKDVEIGQRLIADFTGITFDLGQLGHAWNTIAGNREVTIRELASWAPFLTENHKQNVIIRCVILSGISSSYSPRQRQAIEEIAAAINISDYAFQQARDAALASSSRRAVRSTGREPAESRPHTQSATEPEPNRQVRGKRSGFAKAGMKAVLVALSLVMLLAVLTVAGVFLADYKYDGDQYALGMAHYEKAECTAALSYLDRLTEDSVLGFNLTSLHSLTSMAADAAEQCRLLALAERSQRDGYAARALALYLEIGDTPLPKFIHTEARQRARALIQITRPESLVNDTTCRREHVLLTLGMSSFEDETLPSFYFACGREYAENREPGLAFDMYVNVLNEYPASAAADGVESALIDSDLACEHTDVLLDHPNVKGRSEFIGALYTSCGQQFEADRDYENAVRIYDEFIENFADHEVRKAIEEALSRSLYHYAIDAGAPKLPAPIRSGTVDRGKTVVIIRNDSPTNLQIAFSGPENRLEELEPCASCRRYVGDGPSSCPGKGPLDSYTLKPGTYNVVVRSPTDTDVIPYAGQWTLRDGDENSHCFYIVTTWGRRP